MEEDKVEYIREGIYNEAQLKILRLNKELEIINFCKKSPLQKNETGEWNFITEIRSIGVVYSEIHSKLNTDEKTKVESLKKTLNIFLDKHPVIKEKGKKVYFNECVWRVISHVIEEYDSIVKEMKDKHGFGMPDKLNMRKAAARR